MIEVKALVTHLTQVSPVRKDRLHTVVVLFLKSMLKEMVETDSSVTKNRRI